MMMMMRKLTLLTLWMTTAHGFTTSFVVPQKHIPRGYMTATPFTDHGSLANTQLFLSADNESKEAPAAPAPPEFHVDKLDIRVGCITKAWTHPEADKLFCEEIDIGEEEPRQIASGLRAYYDVDDLVGQRVLVLANLKTRKMVGFPSHGMVMCASKDDKVEFIVPPEGAEIGERISVEGYDGEPATENQILKKKMLNAIFPNLATNDEGVPCYKGVPFNTSGGVCKAQNDLANAEVA